MNVAVVGNDSKFCLQLQELLESQHHRVTLISDAGEAFAKITAAGVHLVVINGLPSRDAAMELIRTLRSHGPTQKLAILSIDPSRKASEVVKTLDAGADDFLAKPFNADIFCARVRTLLRRQIWSGLIQEEPTTTFQVGSLSVQLVERVVKADGREVTLTRLEFDLLAFMVKNKGQVLPRKRLLEAVWQYPEDVETRTLDKHVENLRRKLGKGAGKVLRTVYGVGYRLLDAAVATPGKTK